VKSHYGILRNASKHQKHKVCRGQMVRYHRNMLRNVDTCEPRQSIDGIAGQMVNPVQNPHSPIPPPPAHPPAATSHHLNTTPALNSVTSTGLNTKKYCGKRNSKTAGLLSLPDGNIFSLRLVAVATAQVRTSSSHCPTYRVLIATTLPHRVADSTDPELYAHALTGFE